MEHWKLTQWCTRAVSKIRYTPDRRDVYNELRHHINDRCEDFLAQGMSTEEAADKAVEVMGDPRELAKQLGAIHRPFWGFAYSISKWVMRFAVVIAILVSLSGIYRFFTENRRTCYETHIPPFSAIEDPRITRTLYLNTNSSASCDGYTFTATRVTALLRTDLTPTGYISRYKYLYVELKVDSSFLLPSDFYALDWFWATDSLGNYYGTPRSGTIGNLSYYDTEKDLSRGYYIICVPISPDADPDWIELHYDRDGRNLVLRIDLMGGAIT